MHPTRAISLIEVIVCIAIICVLAALIFPVYGGAKDRAKQTVCVSNLHQYHVALMLYHEDNGEYPPNTIRWPGLKPYFKNTIPRCPISPTNLAPDNQDWDYWHLGFFPEGLEETPNKRACMEKRGPDWPLVQDYNHLKPVVAINTANPHYIIGRQGGSITFVPWSKHKEIIAAKKNGTFARDYPCPLGDDLDNF